MTTCPTVCLAGSELKFKVPKVMVVKGLILSFDIEEGLDDN